jgi:hypothetical protein
MKRKEREPVPQTGAPEVASADPAARRPWVVPAMERMALRDAMAAIGAGAFDGVGSS